MDMKGLVTQAGGGGLAVDGGNRLRTALTEGVVIPRVRGMSGYARFLHPQYGWIPKEWSIEA